MNDHEQGKEGEVSSQGTYLESEIDARGDESGRDDQAADLGLETSFAPRVAVHHHPTDVAYCFPQTAEEQGNEVGPCSGFEA